MSDTPNLDNPKLAYIVLKILEQFKAEGKEPTQADLMEVLGIIPRQQDYETKLELSEEFFKDKEQLYAILESKFVKYDS